MKNIGTIYKEAIEGSSKEGELLKNHFNWSGEALSALAQEIWKLEDALNLRWFIPGRKTKVFNAARNLVRVAREKGVTPSS